MLKCGLKHKVALLNERKDKAYLDGSQPTPYELVAKINDRISPKKNAKIAVFFDYIFAADLIDRLNVEDVTVIANTLNPKMNPDMEDWGIKTATFEEIEGMKFDVVVGNPPFNKSAGGKSGVAGDNNVWARFAILAYDLVKENGKVALITPPNLGKLQRRVKKQIDSVNYLTSHDYWNIRAMVTFGTNAPVTSEPVVQDEILREIYGYSDYNVSRFENPEDIDGVECIIDAKSDGLVYGKAKSEKVIYGPKVIIKTMENKNALVCTDEPAAPKYSFVVSFDTMEEAEKFKLFLENNEIVNFFKNKKKSKNAFLEVIGCKKFNLDQIETGLEIPVEWNVEI